jgi:hypothetical protein
MRGAERAETGKRSRATLARRIHRSASHRHLVSQLGIWHVV